MENQSSKFQRKPFTILSPSNSAGTSGNTSNNQNIGNFKQTIKFKVGNLPSSSNINSNKIIVNNNNIIMNSQKTETTGSSSGSTNSTKSSTNDETHNNNKNSTNSSYAQSLSTAILPQQFYYNPQPQHSHQTLTPQQHHHYHHHIHHHNSKIKRKKASERKSQINKKQLQLGADEYNPAYKHDQEIESISKDVSSSRFGKSNNISKSLSVLPKNNNIDACK